MATFVPKPLINIVNDIQNAIMALAPITSTKLGEVTNTISFAVADQIYELEYGQVKCLELLNDDTKTGTAIDNAVSEYPDMEPRYQATYATGIQTVRDLDVVKISTLVSSGGATSGTTYINANDTSSFPSSGILLVGNRDESNFEYINYTNKTGIRFTPTDALVYDHASSEPIVLATVGDRVFSASFTVATSATSTEPKKTYRSTSSLTIYDGEQEGTMNIKADVADKIGNTPDSTIVNFIGTSPFLTAITYNSTAITNGTSIELDSELRSRLRQHRQSLSTANVDSILLSVNNVRDSDQKVMFSQLYETADRLLPALLYIDDGNAFIPTFVNLSTPIVLLDSAIGGEYDFQVPVDYRPLVTNDSENAAYIFGNITIELNGVPMVQGRSAGQYLIQPDSGTIRFMTPLVTTDHVEITVMRYYTGLFAAANKAIYGDRDDRENWPGSAGLGAWVQLRTPAIYYLSVVGNVIMDGTRVQSEVVTEINQNLMNYVNALGIGGTVIKSKLIALSHVDGVRSISISTPTDNVSILDGQLARLEIGNINIT
jgi:uncharacterized phage protein gp47/JayE